MRQQNLVILLSCILLLISARTSADNKLGVEPFIIKGGEVQSLFIDLENDIDITAVQFDLLLPDGLSIQKDDSGELLIDIAGRTTFRKHSLMANAIDGGYRFLLASSRNVAIEGSAGALIMVTLSAVPTFSGGTLTVTNIELASPNETKIKPSTVSVIINTSNVSDITADNHFLKNGRTYRLDGVKVKNRKPSKGILIVDGQKVVK